MTTTNEPARKGLQIQINDVLGVKAFELELRPGTVNILRGPNGAGKTSAILATLAALGAEVDVEIRDGAKLGTITVTGEGEEPSRTVVPASNRLRVTGGAPAVTAADTAALTRLITADYRKGEKERDKARIEAFLQLVRPKVDDEAVEILTERDAEMGDWLRGQVAAGRVLDLLGAGEALKEKLQELAREREKNAAAWSGQETAHLTRATALLAEIQGELGLPEPVAEPAPATQQFRLEQQLQLVGELQRQAKSREEQQAMQERIRESSTSRPDVAAAEAVARGFLTIRNDWTTKAKEAGLEIAGLREKLRAAEAWLANCEAEALTAYESGKQAESHWGLVQKEANTWDAQQELLNREVTGATAIDVQRAEADLQRARLELARHERSAEIYAAKGEGDKAAKEGSREASRGKQYRDWSKAVHARITDVLEAQGVQGFTIVDGKLAYPLVPGAPAVDFDSRLSTGQQTWAALELAVARFRGLVWIEAGFYGALDPAHQAELERFAQEHPAAILLTEEPTDGELRLAHGTEGA